MDSKKNRRFYFIGLATLFLLILLDQLTKFAAVQFLKGNSSISILPGILELYYLENHGAAWGILVFIICYLINSVYKVVLKDE